MSIAESSLADVQVEDKPGFIRVRTIVALHSRTPMDRIRRDHMLFISRTPDGRHMTCAGILDGPLAPPFPVAK
jgi:hypothetical protein